MLQDRRRAMRWDRIRWYANWTGVLIVAFSIGWILAEMTKG